VRNAAASRQRRSAIADMPAKYDDVTQLTLSTLQSARRHRR
jgi:hypothetical protein